MATYLGKSCSFSLPRVPFVNCRHFMYLVISLLVLRAGCGIWLYQFLIIAYLFTLIGGFDKMTNLTGLTDAHCLHCLVCGNFILSETMEGRPIFTCKPGNIVLKTTNNYWIEKDSNEIEIIHNIRCTQICH